MKILIACLMLISSPALAWRGSLDYGASSNCTSDHIMFEGVLGDQIIGLGYAHAKCKDKNDPDEFVNGRGAMLYYPMELTFKRPNFVAKDTYFMAFNLEYTTIAPRWGAELGYSTGLRREGVAVGMRLLTEGSNAWDATVFLRLQFGSLKEPRGSSRYDNF